MMEKVSHFGNVLLGQPAEQGAIPLLYAATAPDATSGLYIGPDGLFGGRGKGAKPARATKKAGDEQTARRLWDVSQELTGVSYDALTPRSASQS